jgi:ATP-binding cassette, subfamily B, multidrug efflux pump
LAKTIPQSAKAGPAIDDDMAHKPLDRRLMGRLWAFLLPYRWAAISCVFISIAASGLRVAQPVLIHGTIEGEVARGDMAGLSVKMLMLFGLIAMTFAFEVLFNWTTGVIGQKSMHDLRMKIFRHVSRLDVRYFDRTPVGRLITRMTSDVSTLNDLFSSGVIALLADTLMLAGLVGVMMYYSFRLTLIVLLAIPFMLIVVVLFRHFSRKWFLEARGRLARLNSFLQENITGMATVQSLRRESENYGRFTGLNDEYRRAQVNTINAFAFFFPALNLILYLTLTAIIWIASRGAQGLWFLGGPPLEFATLLLFVQCVHMLFAPLRNLSEKYNILQSAMASSARIFRLLDTPYSIAAPPDAKPIESFQDSIRFENVCFEYVEDEPVLNDVSFEIRRGQRVAVVGATGSGKSTLVNLLLRFYDVNSGRITIDGADIRDLDPGRLRSLFAVVLQEVMLFSDTVANNVRLANPELSDEEIWEVLRECRADDFVRELPLGLNHRVRERGATFSTGQKQLLAFARALASDPQFLILDEATANIDTATEGRIQEAIARLLSGRTALVIAHRISTIQKADLILVMHKGCLRESGTHAELLRQGGLYSRLYQLQYQGEARNGAAKRTASVVGEAS